MKNLNLEDTLAVYAGGWSEVEKAQLNQIEPAFCSKINSAKVTQRENTNSATGEVFTSTSICLMMKDGTQRFLKLSPKSTLNVGDDVKVDSLVAIELSKPGEENIIKFDGVAM